MKKMTATQAGAIKKKGKYLADETLYLMVNDKGGKSWMQRLMVNHRRRDYGLGSFKLVTLSQARGLAFENRKLARRGVDPLAEKRKAKCLRSGKQAKKHLSHCNLDGEMRPRRGTGNSLLKNMCTRLSVICPLTKSGANKSCKYLCRFGVRRQRFQGA